MKTFSLHFYFMLSILVSHSLFNVQAQTIQKKYCVKVAGEVLKPLTLYADDLMKMKRTDLPFTDFSGLKYYYSGVALSDMLKEAGAITGSSLQGEDLAKYVLVKGSDGSEVVFSLAELTLNLADETIILADQMNGKPLALGTGPFRIIVPKEKERTRWIWEVTSITVQYAKE